MGDADGQAERLFFGTGVLPQTPTRVDDGLGAVLGHVEGHVVEPHGELVAAQARDHVAGARQFHQHVAQHHDRLVAGLVALDVVDQLEVVHVDVIQRRALVVAQQAVDAARQFLFEEGASVQQTGHAVGPGKRDDAFVVRDLLVGDAELIGDVGDQDAVVVVPRLAVGGAPQGEGAVDAVAVAGGDAQHRPRADLEGDGLAVVGNVGDLFRQRIEAVDVAVFGGNHEAALFVDAVDPPARRGQGPRAGRRRGFQHVLGLQFVADRGHDVAQRLFAAAQPGQCRLAFAFGGDVAADPAHPVPRAVVVDQWPAGHHQGHRGAVGAAHPDLDVLERALGMERDGRVRVGVDHVIDGRLVDQVLGLVADGALRRHEHEIALGVDLPGEVGVDLDQVLVALARFHQGGTQIAFHRQVTACQQNARAAVAAGQRHGGHVQRDRAAFGGNFDDVGADGSGFGGPAAPAHPGPRPGCVPEWRRGRRPFRCAPARWHPPTRPAPRRRTRPRSRPGRRVRTRPSVTRTPPKHRGRSGLRSCRIPHLFRDRRRHRVRLCRPPRSSPCFRIQTIGHRRGGRASPKSYAFPGLTSA